MRLLVMEARLRKVALPALVGQISMALARDIQSVQGAARVRSSLRSERSLK